MEYIIIHAHEMGFSAYPISTDFDLLEDLNGSIEAEQQAQFLAELMGLHFQPWKGDTVELTQFVHPTAEMSREEFLGKAEAFRREQVGQPSARADAHVATFTGRSRMTGEDSPPDEED